MGTREGYFSKENDLTDMAQEPAEFLRSHKAHTVFGKDIGPGRSPSFLYPYGSASLFRSEWGIRESSIRNRGRGQLGF
jgi:hypothetical protein